ncbi:MAG: hypothetical protein Q9191_003712 [Dirinaria sp. TL-2023a]
MVPALVIDRHPVKPPATASPEEYHCQWYQLTDRVQYLPSGLAQGKVTYNVCFHDLVMGLQTHCFAPAGLDIKGKWTVGGSLPGEPKEPSELGLGLPKHGLWLREDVDMRCNVLMTSFVKKTLKKAHSTLVARLVQKAHLMEAESLNDSLSQLGDRRNSYATYNTPGAPPAQQTQPYSDVSSLRSSDLSQSPQCQQDGFTPMTSPFQSVDPAYRDAQDSYLAHRKIFTNHLAGSHKPSQTMLHPSNAIKLPQDEMLVELPTAASPQHHELPARLFDNYE